MRHTHTHRHHNMAAVPGGNTVFAHRHGTRNNSPTRTSDGWALFSDYCNLFTAVSLSPLLLISFPTHLLSPTTHPPTPCHDFRPWFIGFLAHRPNLTSFHPTPASSSSFLLSPLASPASPLYPRLLSHSRPRHHPRRQTKSLLHKWWGSVGDCGRSEKTFSTSEIVFVGGACDDPPHGLL